MALDPNKIIPNVDGVQHLDARYFRITPQNFAANNNVVEIELPPYCQVVAGSLNVTVASNQSGTDTVKIGDAADDDRLLADTDIKTVALTPIPASAFIFGKDGTAQKLRLTRTPAGTAATAGEVHLYLATVALGKAYHTQG